MSSFDLDDRSALVTGGASGIGRAIAVGLANAGAAVVVADLDESGADTVAEQITAAGGTARAARVDVTVPEDVERGVRAAADLGTFRIAVNNAGIASAHCSVADIDMTDWLHVLDVDLTSVLVCMQAEIREFRRHGGGGSVINVASMYGGIAIAGSAPYVAAKHGVVGLTKSAALDHAEDDIRVNAIGPGFVLTPLNEERLSTERKELLSEQTPLRRMARPEEVAGLAVYLASDAASFSTGGFHLVDGGFSTR